MKRAALVVLTVASFAACTDQREPTAAKAPRLSADISDATHTSSNLFSNPHFFWLPPLVAAPSPTGVFNPGLSPAVQICSQLVTPCPPGQVHAAFTATSGTGSQTVRVDVTNQLYIVNWKTSATAEPAGSSFRIAVLAHDRVLGFADVDMIASGKMKNAFTGDDVPLVDGATLPIKFRVEQGALAATCGDPSHPLDCVEQQAFPGQDNTIVTPALQAGTFIPAGALSQTVTVTILQNTNRPCIPPPFALPQFPACYDFFTDPGPTQFNTPVIVGLCIQTELVGAVERQLQIFQFDPGQAVRALDNVPATFLPCNSEGPVIGSRELEEQGFLASVRAGLRSFWHTLAPPPLVAAHLGAGGSSGSYSTFTWSFVSEVVKNSTDPQTAIVGTPVGSAPTVLLRDTTSAHNPVSGVTITFTVDGGGTIANATAVTGSDGLASSGTWTLGSTPGTNHVIATADGAIGSPITFTATGAAALIFQATFTADAGGSPPGPPEIGSWTMSSPDGTILVQSAVGNLTSKPVELTQLGLQAGSVELFGTVAGTPPASGVYVARWRSLVHSADACFNALVLRDAGSLILADVDYRPGGQLTYNSNSLNVTVGSWTRDVAQLFEITVDLDNHVTSLSIDGVPVTAAQGLPFSDPTGTPANLGQINMELGCIAPQDYAWDDITIARQ